MRTFSAISAAIVTAAAVAIAGAADPPATAPAAQLFADGRLVTLPRISVEVVGTGPNLVLVPGLGCSRAVWRATADRLRGRYTLHLVQVAGFAGESPRANATGPVVDPVVEAIDGYLADAKVGPVLVIGHSLGGTMSLRLAQRHPADVRRVMLVDSLPFFGVLVGGPAATADSVKGAATAMRDRVVAAQDSAAAKAAQVAGIRRMVKAPADVDRVVGWSRASDPRVVGQAAYEDVVLDMRPELAAMSTPVTLVYPFDAALGVPLAGWDGLYQGQFAGVPHHALVRVDDARHFVMYDQPAKFDAAVDAFLAE